MNVLFAGTPDFSVPPLTALLHSQHQVLAVLTQPDRPAGRGRKLQPSPVKRCALEHGLSVLQPDSLKTPEIQQQLAAFQADVLIVVAFGMLLPQAVLDIPRHGCLNIHASLLPRWRGAAPIHRAIAAGDDETGVSIMQMDAGLDTGDVLHTVRTPITATDTTGSLHDTLATLGAEALLESLQQIEQGTHTPVPQDNSQANYAHKLSKQEMRIDWQQPAEAIARQVRAFNPWPVAQTNWQETTYRVWQAEAVAGTHPHPGQVLQFNKDFLEVACGSGSLRIHQIQAPGKKPVPILDFFNAQQHTPFDYFR